MRITQIGSFMVVLLAASAGLAPAAPKQYAHQEYFEHYEGTQTCLECHEQEAENFLHTRHYRWKGESPEIVNLEPDQEIGKANVINDFCTNPTPNWIGAVKNSDGKILARGCSACHAGQGVRPNGEISREQLENIDCLLCHASGYRREVYPTDDGGWEWRPILWRNQRGLDSVAKRISLPTRKMCLRCHSGAGGGQNFKRGDLEYALADCERDFDVHMASDGLDMQCIDCHADEDHRVRGRGSDLGGPEPKAADLSCENCHDAQPHAVAILDRHTRRVDCTVCHIPTFAKQDPTDMVRDWSTPRFHEEANKYSATITFGKDVVPAYAWFNGKSRVRLQGKPVLRLEDGTVGIALPEGSRRDRASKIHAFKLHRGVMPVLKDRQWLLPIAVEEFFANGRLEEAVVEGARSFYGIEGEVDYEWAPTVRYMAINHEVVPAERALQCLDCHREGGRMDWKALGYEKDPLLDAID